MENTPLQIKPMTPEQVDTAVDWAAAEGWNPGLHDAACYSKAGGGGFIGGFLQEQMIGCISAMRYSNDFGFIGFYMVKPPYRGQGYGIQLWQAALQHLKGCNIGLDGVTEQQHNYQRSGFKLAYRNIRYQGAGTGRRFDRPSIEHHDDASIVPLSELALDSLLAFEQDFFPAKRHNFTQAWIQQPDSQALALVNNKELQGYGVIRRCRSGYKIGPLFANSADVADTLYQALTSSISPDQPVFLDVPEINSNAMALAQRHGMQPSFETARMYTGETPDICIAKTYGVTSFEIG
jgi:GNAT superfamily N-acetyltransferase